jgi:hypothetical protein
MARNIASQPESNEVEMSMGEQPATAARDDSITDAITQRTNTRIMKITHTPIKNKTQY